jgi:two-component system nitrogen regulation sensor histidine kinase NtrY
MDNKRHIIIFAVLTAVFLILSLITESVYLSDFEYRFRTIRFNKILREKERIMNNCLNDLKLIIMRGEPHGSTAEKNIFSIAVENNITILEYLDNKLVYWSDNDFDVPLNLDNTLLTKPFIFQQNGWFLTDTVQSGNEEIIGLLRVRFDYGFENDIIKSGFVRDFRIPDDVGFSTESDNEEYNIVDSSGRFLFSLSFPEIKKNTPFIIIPLLFWSLFFIFLQLLAIGITGKIAGKGKALAGIIFTILVSAIIYSVLLFSGKPEVVFRTGLFSPYIFTLNTAIPSLGHLLVLSILAVVIAYVFFVHFPLKADKYKAPAAEYFLLTTLFIVSAFLLSLFQIIFSRLILGSNISFETYKVLDLSFFSIAGFLSMILLLFVPVLIILKSFRIIGYKGLKSIIIPALCALVVMLIYFYRDPVSLSSSALLFIVLVIAIAYSGIKKISMFAMSVVFSLIFGIYSLVLITVYSEQKNTENIKIQALSFSTDNDPEAENLLLDMWPLISNDSILRKMMEVEIFSKNDYDRIYTYLLETYFTGYWGNYNFSIVTCRNDQSLLVGNSSEPCFGFFDERIKKYGHYLTGTDFYFMDNQAGRSYYLGKLLFRQNAGFTNGLFIELYSGINVFQPGYSELLLDKKFRGYSGLRDYSFAKYINGEIVIKSGDYPYNKTDEDYVRKDSEYRFFNGEGFKHLVFRNGNVTVIISRPRMTARDLTIAFAYLFAFIFIFTNIVMLMIRRPEVKRFTNLNFRQKLQLSFIGILLFSFILIGVVVTFLTISQYRSKHDENIKEKMNSIYLELDNNLSYERYLATDWRNSTNTSLNALLINLSNLFNTDINLYDLNGFLLATSRPEIFIRDLTSKRMNALALINIQDLTKSEYIQMERIGNLQYLSAYVPFYNTEGRILAYLNLPYFRMQSLLAKEISNMVIAIINFTLLLVLITVSAAVFIGGRLTSPLAMLGKGLASVELGKKSEHLVYESNDEIGELVKQYNRMVDELDESAEKLANSEREYAWREMAKQIAHEIKNPLTPMKLNVQQLLKSWKDKVPDFDKKLGVFSKNQIELIDNLSSIASAFSSFAKMPGAAPGLVNLLEQIQITLELFRNSTNVTFWVQWPHESKVFIYADKEQLNGIFSNLFKNSIQAIPRGRQGLINVSLEMIGDKVIIAVEDNGTGIPGPLQKKLFTPNFTTKSSGTGLGLSIVKKYVESARGRVWFKSEADKGTTFYLEFPLMYTVEKPGGTPPV